MTQPSKNKGAASARPAEAVASEAARSAVNTGDTTAPPVDDNGPDLSHCGDCGSEEVVYVTEDPAAEPRGYCATHKPANVTDKMVEEQQAGR